jgi:hypothetical protein
LTITDIFIETPSEFQPILQLLSQVGSLPVTEVSFEVTITQLEHLNQVPWGRLRVVLEEHCARMEKLSIGLSLLSTYGRKKLNGTEKEQMKAIVRKGCHGRIEEKLEFNFLA